MNLGVLERPLDLIIHPHRTYFKPMVCLKAKQYQVEPDTQVLALVFSTKILLYLLYP